MTVIAQIAGYCILAYLALVVFMFFRQESFLFFPTRSQHLDQQLEHVQGYTLTRDSAVLRGWLVHPQYARRRLIVYFGGNAEDVFLNIDEFEDIQAATLLIAYRGYGPSSGRPGEDALFHDALAVIDDLMTHYRPDHLFIFGRSLGSGVACYVAAHRQISGLVLITPYDSMENVARQHYPWLPISLLLRHRFNSMAFATAIKQPVLVLYGTADTVVSPARTENLIKFLPPESRTVLLDGADHGTVSLYPRYWQEILEFIDRTENPQQ